MNFRMFTENNSVILLDGVFSCQGLTSHTPLRFPFLRSSRPRSLAEAEGGPVKLHTVVPRFLEAIAKREKIRGFQAKVIMTIKPRYCKPDDRNEQKLMHFILI